MLLGDYIALYEEAMTALRQCNVDKSKALKELQQAEDARGGE